MHELRFWHLIFSRGNVQVSSDSEKFIPFFPGIFHFFQIFGKLFKSIFPMCLRITCFLILTDNAIVVPIRILLCCQSSVVYDLNCKYFYHSSILSGILSREDKTKIIIIIIIPQIKKNQHFSSEKKIIKSLKILKNVLKMLLYSYYCGVISSNPML